MKTRFNETYENDETPSIDIVRQHRNSIDNDKTDTTLALVHYRGGNTEFLIGEQYCHSSDAKDRAIGADVLAQLGWQDRTFIPESIPILIKLLEDEKPYVVYCAAVALGHREDPRSIPHLIKKINDPDPLVRYGVTFGLLSHEDERALAALIKLTKDKDHDVRNWATFGLGSQIELDTPEIRESLYHMLDDEDHEIRGEALLGLAKRKDQRIIPELLNEWKDDDVSILSLEAAEELADERLHLRLLSFTEILVIDNDQPFIDQMNAAIKACRPTQ